jgi:hypothetical protein
VVKKKKKIVNEMKTTIIEIALNAIKVQVKHFEERGLILVNRFKVVFKSIIDPHEHKFLILRVGTPTT